MDLSAFITANARAIVDAWEDFARSLSPDETSLILRNHAAHIVASIARDMETAQTKRQEAAKSQGHGPEGLMDNVTLVHVHMRINSGFDLVEIMAEYRALRASIIRLWSVAYPADFAAGALDLVRFSESLDQHIATTIRAYGEREALYRDRFLGMLGHDLRNPIQVISGSTAILKDVTGVEARPIIDRIDRVTVRMSHMVSDILDFARGRLGSVMPLTIATVDLVAVIHQIVDEVDPQRKDDVIVETPTEVVGRWDEERLKQMIGNLLSNALQYGEKPIRITVETDKTTAWLRVQNSGKPISPKMMPVLFDPLVRGAGHDANQLGLGLGLFIVKQIVETHNGSVSVSSTEDATTFVVGLPLQQQ